MRTRCEFLVLFLLLLPLSAACRTWDDLEGDRDQAREKAGDEVSANIGRASAIIAAIDAYEEMEGRLPQQLATLVPTYLSDIPSTATGGSFTYERDDRFGQGYYLCFDVSVTQHPGCCYHRRLMVWDCSGGCE
jgi:hypothetical protein